MEIPVDRVIKLAREGYSDIQIIKHLKEEGYTPRQINDAFNQAKVKLELNKESEVPRPGFAEEEQEATEETEEIGEMQPSIASEEPTYDVEYGESTETPVPQAEEAESEYRYQYPAARASVEDVEELVSEIVEEKWQEFRKKTASLLELGGRAEQAIRNFEKRLARVEAIIKKLSEAATEKFQEHGREVGMLRAETHALKETLSKIMKPLMTKVKEKTGMLEPKKQIKTDKKKKAKEKQKKREKKTIDSLFI